MLREKRSAEHTLSRAAPCEVHPAHRHRKESGPSLRRHLIDRSAPVDWIRAQARCWPPFSMARSTTSIGLRIGSMVPPRVIPPATTRPPFNGLPSSAEQRPTRTPTPSCSPLLAASNERSCSTNSCSRGLRSPTSSRDLAYRFCSAMPALSRKGPWGRLVQNSDAATGAFRHLDPEQSRAIVLATEG